MLKAILATVKEELVLQLAGLGLVVDLGAWLVNPDVTADHLIPFSLVTSAGEAPVRAGQPRAVPLQARRGREPAVRRGLGHLHGGYAQPLGLESDDGDRSARDVADRRQGQRADAGPHVAVAGGEEHLVQLPRPRLSRDVILRPQSAISAGFAVPS